MREYPCGQAEESLSDLIDGELDAAEKRRVAIHAASCEHCAQVLGGLYATKAALEVPLPEKVSVPRAFWSQVRDRLDHVDGVIRATNLGAPRRPAPRLARAGLAVGLAAIAVLSLLHAVSVFRPDPLAQLAQLHATVAPGGGGAALQQTVGFGLHSPWQTLGKRLVDSGGTMVMQTVYSVDGLPVSIFRLPGERPEIKRLVPVQTGSQTIYLGALEGDSLVAVPVRGAWEIIVARTTPEDLLRLAAIRPRDMQYGPGL